MFVVVYVHEAGTVVEGPFSSREDAETFVKSWQQWGIEQGETNNYQGEVVEVSRPDSP